MGRAVGAYAQFQLDASPEALSDMIDIVAWLAPRGNKLFTSLIYGRLAEVHALAGRVDETRRAVGQALRRGRGGDSLGVAMACRAMAQLEAKCSAAAKARLWIDRALATAARRGSAHERASTLLCAAEVELTFGQPDRAARLIDEASTAFKAASMAWHLAQADRLRLRIRSPGVLTTA